MYVVSGTKDNAFDNFIQEKGAQWYILLLIVMVEEETILGELLVVSDFFGVFLDEVLGLLLKKKVEFTIYFRPWFCMKF
ncbi:hypothetical protein CR513_62183, partial [Mucuna pruriens]